MKNIYDLCQNPKTLVKQKSFVVIIQVHLNRKLPRNSTVKTKRKIYYRFYSKKGRSYV